MSIKRELVGPTRQGGFIGIRRALLLRRRQGPSLNIDFSTGSGLASLIAFTYTRATSATITDFEGLIKSCLSGELRIYGARRVRNWLGNSGTITTGAGWAIQTGITSVEGATDPEGSTTAYTITRNHVTNSQVYYAITTVAGTQWGQSIWARRVTGSGGVRFLSASGLGGTDISGQLTTTWKRFSSAVITSTGTTIYFGIQLDTNGDAIQVWHPQMEDVTGQANQNPSEYVSVGVLSSPFHGYFADGVKYFSYENGNTVSSNVVTEAQGAAITGTMGYLVEGQRTNLCLQSNAFTTTWTEVGSTGTTQDTVGPDGATSAWTLTDNDAGATEHRFQDINVSNATTYTYSKFVKKTSGALTSYPVIQVFDFVANKMAGGTIDTTAGTVAKWTAYTGVTMLAVFSVGCESFNDDYWRVWCTFLTESANTHRVYLIPAGRTAYSTTGPNDVAATGSATYFGAQLEAAPFASSYIPTTTAAVTRNSDALTVPVTGLFSNAEGSVYAEFMFLGTAAIGATRSVLESSGGPSGGIQLYNGGSDKNIQNYDTTNAAIKTLDTAMLNRMVKAASSWGPAGLLVTGDGLTPASAAFDGSLAIGNSLAIGGAAQSAFPLWGIFKNVKTFNKQQNQARLMSITA